MAKNKKSSSPKMSEEEKAKLRAQMEKERAKAAKKKAKEQAKIEKGRERYEKAVKAERERAAEEAAKQAELANDPAYQAKKEKEAQKMKEKGAKEAEKLRKQSAKKAAAAAKTREKQRAKAAKQHDKGLDSVHADKGGAAQKVGRPVRDKRNIAAIIVIIVIMIASVFMLYPPQDKITQGLDIQGGVSINLKAVAADGTTPTQDQMDAASKVITARVNTSGASAASVQQQGSSAFLVQVPGAEDSESIINTLSSQGILEFVRVDAIEDETVRNYIENGITGMNLNNEGVSYTAFMTGDSVSNVSVSHENGQYAVDLTLDSEGTSSFADVSSELVSSNGQIAILLDGVVKSAPAVQSAITNGQVQITGNYTVDEANDLMAIINSGSLPVTLNIEQSSVVGPTLGQSALKAGIISGCIGIVLVILWLVIFYGGLGLLTGLSIVVMGAIYLGLLAMLSQFGWFSLTLSGIAGIIVNIGLAADSSILILECFHEQVRKGRSIKASAYGGVREGILTSIDADIVTLVSALMLYFVAVGDVKGFGLTLALGILCDLLVLALFSGPVVRLLGNKNISKHLGFWGLRDDAMEGNYVAKEVK